MAHARVLIVEDNTPLADTLCDLLEEVRFDRVGAFTYSAQEGTRAAALAGCTQ